MEQAPKAKARRREEAGGNAALRRKAKALRDRVRAPVGAGEQAEVPVEALEEVLDKAQQEAPDRAREETLDRAPAAKDKR
jgi:hypothetical protein